MISILNLFEQPNVPNEQPNGLTAPFGSFSAYEKENKKKLADAQELSTMNQDDQISFMRKIGVLT
jgi:hypothetical protein